MAAHNGNAWAQMKAREREQQLQQQSVDPGKVAIPRKGPIMSISSGQRPRSTRSCSGLDYDAELAVPMPKPRHIAPPSSPGLAAGPQSSIIKKPYVSQMRSTTEPVRPVENNEKKTGEIEKKKSKVATLRSKFSLKDIGKELRRDPAPTCPPRVGNALDDDLRQSPGFDVKAHFDEERLYVPKPRRAGVYPSSAPPFQTTTPFRGSLDQSSHDSIVSAASARQPTKEDEIDAEILKVDQAANKDKAAKTPLQRSIEPIKHVGNLLLEGTRAGAYSNNRQPDIVKAQPSVCSLRAEREPGSSPLSSNVTLHPAGEGTPYTPSVHDKTMARKASETPVHDHPASDNRSEKSLPVVVSSGQRKGSSSTVRVGKGKPLTLWPTAPSFEPRTTTTSPDDSQLSVTSHGGYAPAPPYPGYQNTVTLEQQLASQVDSLHHHMDNAVSRLTRTFENTNNWTADQILRQVDTMSDIGRLMNTRAVGQMETVKETHRFMNDIWAQVNVIQQETRQMEERLSRTVQMEIARLRTELSSALIPCNPVQDSKIPSTEFQGTRASTATMEATRDNEKRAKRKPRVGKKEVVAGNTGSEKGEHKSKQEGESVSVGENSLNKHAEEQTPSEAIPAPTTAFHTPMVDQQANKADNGFTNLQRTRSVRKNPGQESSGSPESKTAQLKENILTEGTLSSYAPKLPQLPETEHRPNGEDGKAATPHRKGMFNFRRRREGEGHIGSSRFLRTPRRGKESSKAPEDQSAPPATPPVPAIPMNVMQSEKAQGDEEESPSSVHPALRNPKQQQIMREREHRNWQPRPNHQPHDAAASSSSSNRGRRRALRHSQSLQNFGSRPPMSFNRPSAPPYGTPSASSSHRDMNMRHHASNYLQPAPFMTPTSTSFISTPRYGQGGSRNLAWASVPPPMYPPLPMPVQCGPNDWDTSSWYHEAYGQRSTENNNFF
ncbi:hypothetical protein AWENTII_007566 [Aspergillus wentii]|nr:hypothetical protein MW887_011230 [Aspergillus wentii]